MPELKYNGGGDWIPGIPARDLSAAEVDAIAEGAGLTPSTLVSQLTARGVYKAAQSKSAGGGKKAAPKEKSSKEGGE